MKQFKTDQFGFYGGPHQNYVIEGDESSTPITTNNLPYPIIATSPDGTTKMLSSNENTIFPGNTVVEMKAQMGAQVGDQREQMMQLISAYCQVTGGDESCPQAVMQGLQESPQEMMQQMVAVVQQAQQSQQGQQPQEQMMAKDGGCMDCQEQFPQAQNLNWFYKAEGGTAFPAANMYPESWIGYNGTAYIDGGDTNSLLNIPESVRFPFVPARTVTYPEGYWESKTNSNIPLNPLGQPFATGAIEESISPLDFIGGVRGGMGLIKGAMKYRQAMKPNYIEIGEKLFDMGSHPKTVRRAVNQMNKGLQNLVLPNAFEDGGMTEEFSQAQTYLPYDRPGETRLNGMAEYGGQSDLDRAYQMMKQGGFDMDPKKKRGGKFDAKSFQDYVMKNGGYLPKHQIDGIVGFPNNYENSILRDYLRAPTSYDYPTFPQGTTYDEKTDTMISPERFKQNNPDGNPEYYWVQTFNKNLESFNKRSDNDHMLYEQGLNHNNTPSVTSATSTQTEADSVDKLPSYPQIDVQSQSLDSQTNTKLNKPKGRPRTNVDPYGLGMYYMNTLASSSENPTLKRLAAIPNIVGAGYDMLSGYGKAASGIFDNLQRVTNSGRYDPYARVGTAKAGGSKKGLPTFQGPEMSQVGANLFPTGNYSMWDNPSVPSWVANTSAYQNAQDQQGMKIADQNVITQGLDTEGNKPFAKRPKPKSKYQFNDPATMAMKASKSIGKLAMATNLMADARRLEEERKRNRITGSTDVGYMPTVAQQNLGNYMVNTSSGEPFRPNQQVFPQDIGTPVSPMAATYSTRQGGSIFDRYRDGGVYNLTMDEIRKIYEEGGEIEFLED